MKRMPAKVGRLKELQCGDERMIVTRNHRRLQFSRWIRIDSHLYIERTKFEEERRKALARKALEAADHE